MPTVTKVRKEQLSDRSHEHIEGVCSTAGVHYTRDEVVRGLRRGEDWHTSANGQSAKIREITYCPGAGCYVTPYITTAPDHTTANNLENLPPC